MSLHKTNESTVSLANGVTVPAMGFGCAFGDWVGKSNFQGFLPEQAWQAFPPAIKAGYRHFDGAHCYGTERHLGDCIGAAMARGELDRESVFLSTKLAHPAAPQHVAVSHRLTWDWDKVPDIATRVRDDFDASKEKVGVGYFDLVMLHWPGPFGNAELDFAQKARATIWETFETLYRNGQARAIGVSNFTKRHLLELKDTCEIQPMVNQIELHPYCFDPDLIEFCHANDIVVEAYAPLASGAFGLLQDPVLVEIAEHTGCSVGQVILRWLIQHGCVVLTKSTNPQRIAQNREVFDFELSVSTMRQIDGLAPKEAKRTTLDPETIV